ncbi:MAG: efflux RND transporter periplasmic adaptor subunit, partial [Candidatus Methylomirabilis sp.]|nr:efflux RND transporter periplasmic adaptor subunit [Deltaproteobacteria bacterium]
ILGHHVLYAPYDALVVERHQELGAVLAPGEPVFTLIDPETVWVLGYVDESRAGGVRVGQPAEVRLRSLPGRSFPGEVVRVGVESDRVNEERRVYVACSNCPRPIHLGEQAEVFVTTGRLERAVLVPETAVDAVDDARGVVWTVEDGRLRRREVTLGERTLDGRVRIADGLAAGALAVTEPGQGFREGRRARPLGDGPT